MRRIVVSAIVVVGLVALAAAVVPSLVSANFLKQKLAERITGLTGRKVVLAGDPALSIYPHLAISIGDVTIANPKGMGDEPFIAATSVTARLRLTPLLIGQVKFNAFELFEPRIHLTVDGEGRRNWLLRVRNRADNGSAVAGDFGRIVVTNGTVVYDDPASGLHEEMTALQLDVQWPDPSDALSGTGSLQWRGQTAEFNGAIADPRTMAEGSPVRFAVAATPLRVSFNGTLTSLDNYQLAGEATVTTPSLRRTIEWLAVPTGTGSILGAASITGTANWFGSTISFTDAEVELDGNVAEGTLAVDFSAERPAVRGTLASPKLDLSPYLEAMRANLTAEGPWLIAPTTLPVVNVLDADMRVSTGEILMGPLRIGRAAIVATIKDGKATIDVGEAQFYGGTMEAHATAAMNGETLSSRAEVEFKSVATGAALTDLAAITALEGIGAATVDIGSRGRNWGEFAQGINGTVAFDIADGSLTGVDVNEIAAMAPELWPAPMIAGDGATRFTRLAGTLAITDGGVDTDDLVADGQDFRVVVSGWGSFVGGRIDAEATVTKAGSDGETQAVPLAVGGTWGAPEFVLDRDRMELRRETTPAGTGPRG